MKIENEKPIVTIGVPLFNSGETIREVLDCLVNQTYRNIQIVISDNCSTDSTVSICREYSQKDQRISLYNQQKNIGAVKNFEFVLSQAIGEYFMWSAGDDIRSQDFIEVNLLILLREQTYVASTSPNIHSDQVNSVDNIVNYALEGNKVQRFRAFFNNPGASHGIFYSLMRTDIIKLCPQVKSRNFWGWDWIVILYLLTYGPIYRTEKGLTTFGANGVSRSSEIYNLMGIKGIRRLIPFMDFNREIYKLINDWQFRDKTYVYFLTFSLNLKTLLKSNRHSHYLFFNLKRIFLTWREAMKTWK